MEVDIYDGVYTFERYREGDEIELAPDLYVTFVSEGPGISCRANSQHCIEGGERKFIIRAYDKDVTVSSHDDQYNRQSHFVVDGISYTIMGHGVKMYPDWRSRPPDKIIMKYTVYREISESRRDYSKESDVEVHKLDELFHITVMTPPGTGYDTDIHLSDGLMIMDAHPLMSGRFSLEALNNGTLRSNKVGTEYVLKGIRRGEQEITIERVRPWDPSSRTAEVRHVRII